MPDRITDLTRADLHDDFLEVRNARESLRHIRINYDLPTGTRELEQALDKLEWYIEAAEEVADL